MSDAKKKILVVDDEKDILDLLEMRLELEGYIPLLAKNGTEGLKILQEEDPDLVILDIMMPQLDGYSFIKELKKIKSIPVIVLTAKYGMKDLFAIEGVEEYITKPFSPEELTEKVKKIIGE